MRNAMNKAKATVIGLATGISAIAGAELATTNTADKIAKQITLETSCDRAEISRENVAERTKNANNEIAESFDAVLEKEIELSNKYLYPSKPTAKATQKGTADFNDFAKKIKNNQPEILGGGDGDLKIDRTTYKITCENCSADAELDGTLKLLNNTPITDVNRATVVAAFMWIEDNLPENQQLNNKLAILVKYGNDEETITDMREGNTFRYDYNNVNSQITAVMNWFDTQSASPLAFISRLMNDYGITTTPKEETASNTTTPKTETAENDDDDWGENDFDDTEENAELEKKDAELEKQLKSELARKKALLNDISKTDAEIKQLKKEIAEIDAKLSKIQ